MNIVKHIEKQQLKRDLLCLVIGVPFGGNTIMRTGENELQKLVTARR